MGYFYLALILAVVVSAANAQKATDVSADFEQQLRQEESTEQVIYDIELLHWKNELGKTYTGRYCNETTKTATFACDPLFKYNVEVFRNRTKPVEGGAHIIANQTCMTWPGKTPVSQWQVVGKDDYDDVSELEKIGIVRLSPVPEGELQDVVFRVAIFDRSFPRDLKSAIGFFMCILPGTSNGRYMKLKPAELRSQSLWSGPMHCFPAAHFDRFLAPYIDFDAQREQELIVRFRAYHEDDKKDTAAEQQQAEVEHLAAGGGTEASKPVIRGYRRYNRNYGGGGSRYKRSANFIGLNYGFGLGNGFYGGYGGYPYYGGGFGYPYYGGGFAGGFPYGGYRSFYGGYPARF